MAAAAAKHDGAVPWNGEMCLGMGEFAMVFTVARMVIPIPPILKSGFTGIEIVVWTAIALAAFVPSLILDWKSIVPRQPSAAAAD